MSDSVLNELWETLESLAASMEDPQSRQEQLAVALEGCLVQVLRYPPEQLVAKSEGSALPTRPLVSWLAFEADRLGAAPEALALRQYWQTTRQASEGPIIPPPARAMI